MAIQWPQRPRCSIEELSPPKINFFDLHIKSYFRSIDQTGFPNLATRCIKIRYRRDVDWFLLLPPPPALPLLDTVR